MKMAFTAADVKTLREMTGVGMMDCNGPGILYRDLAALGDSLFFHRDRSLLEFFSL